MNNHKIIGSGLSDFINYKGVKFFRTDKEFIVECKIVDTIILCFVTLTVGHNPKSQDFIEMTLKFLTNKDTIVDECIFLNDLSIKEVIEIGIDKYIIACTHPIKEKFEDLIMTYASIFYLDTHGIDDMVFDEYKIENKSEKFI